MADFWMQKNLHGQLEADDDAARSYLKKIKAGEGVLVKVRKPRNAKFHRKYFALLNIVFENQEKYEDFEAFRKELIMRAGFWKEHHHVTGTISYEAKSIAFDNMDELEFDDLYSKSIDAAIKHFMPGTDRDLLIAAVLEFGG